MGSFQHFQEPGCDFRQRQHRIAKAGLGDRTGHAPHHAGSFVLTDGGSASFDNLPCSGQTVLAHPSKYGHQNSAFACHARGAQHGIDRGAAEILRRVHCHPRPEAVTTPLNQQVPVTRSEVDPTCNQGFAIARLGAGHQAQAVEVVGQDRGEGCRHVLGDDDWHTDRAPQALNQREEGLRTAGRTAYSQQVGGELRCRPQRDRRPRARAGSVARCRIRARPLTFSNSSRLKPSSLTVPMLDGFGT